MDRAAIRQTLIHLFETDIGEDFSQIEDSSHLRQQLGLDSVDLVSVVAQIERHFRIRLSQQELESLATVGDVLDLLVGKVGAAPGVKAA